MIISENTKTISNEQAGGKGFNLFKLSKNSFPVPRFTIIPAQTFIKFKGNNGLDKQINDLLGLLTHNYSINEINKISTHIQNLIQEAPISHEISHDVNVAYK